MEISEKQLLALRKAGEWLEDYLSPEHGVLDVKTNSIAGKVLHDYKQAIAEISMYGRPQYCKKCHKLKELHDLQDKCPHADTFFELNTQ